MRTGHLIFSALNLFVVLLILSFGIFLLLLSGSLEIKLFLQKFLMEESHFFVKLGLGIFILGCVLLGVFYALNRKKYLTLKMQASKTLIDEAIIRDYLDHYWKEIFPNGQIHSDLVFHFPQKLEIILQLPKIESIDKEDLLSRIQSELGVLLARKLGYEKEFFLTITESSSKNTF